MRLAAHYAFSFGIGALAFGASLPGALLAFAEAYLVNRLIDMPGEGGRPTASTHTVPGALAVGIPVGVVTAIILVLWGSPMLVRGVLQARVAAAAVVDGAAAGLSHLLLDYMSSEGIYVGGRRVSLTGWRPDGPAAAAFIAIGLLMAAASLI